MDGSRVRDYFSNEVKSLLELYNQFAILVPSEHNRGAAHVCEDGRYVEALIRECLQKFLPNGIELLTGFIMRPATKTGIKIESGKMKKTAILHSWISLFMIQHTILCTNGLIKM